jgi:hypothetical protein
MLGEFSITASWERPRDIGREWIPRQSSDPCALLDLAENFVLLRLWRSQWRVGVALALHQSWRA